MTDSAPQYPSPIVCIELDKLGLTQGEIAERLGVGRITVNRLMNGHARITTDLALGLERLTGISADHWSRLQMDWDLWMARGKGKVPV